MKITARKLLKLAVPYGALVTYRRIKPKFIAWRQGRMGDVDSEVGMTGLRFDPAKIKTIEEQILFAKHQFAYDYARDVARKMKASTVLDYGSGDGYGADFLAEHLTEVDIYATDIDEASVKEAKDKYRRKNLHFIHMKDLKKYDLVVSYQVIEHVEDVEEYLRQLQGMLNKSGKIIISTPDRRYRLTVNQAPWNPYHLREYTKRGLLRDIQKVFPDGRILQLSGDKNMLRIEYSRVASSRSDKAIYRGKMPEKLSENYSSKDFYLSEKDTVDSLDLFAVVDSKSGKKK